jgi:hypothetical protein
MQTFSHEAPDFTVCLEVGKLGKVGKTENDCSLDRNRFLFLQAGNPWI